MYSATSISDRYMSQSLYIKLRRAIEHVVPSFLPENDQASPFFRERLTLRILEDGDEIVKLTLGAYFPMARFGATRSTTCDPSVFNVVGLRLGSISTPVGP